MEIGSGSLTDPYQSINDAISCWVSSIANTKGSRDGSLVIDDGAGDGEVIDTDSSDMVGEVTIDAGGTGVGVM